MPEHGYQIGEENPNDTVKGKGKRITKIILAEFDEREKTLKMENISDDQFLIWKWLLNKQICLPGY